MTRLIIAPLFVAVLLASGEADAQMFFKHRGRAAVAGGYSAPVGSTVAAPGGPIAGTSAPATTPYPFYSYYAAYPAPARGYMGYGSGDDFAFHGQAYGHPYDKWTWPYMTGSNALSVTRYYDPPVK